MKALVCEMCASPNLIKKDGMYVCENCGTRYTVEEAKRMMIDGTVDIQGTVKVDNSSFVKKQLTNARRALAKEDWEEVEKYYNRVEEYAPSNIEAVFFSAYGKALLSFTDKEYYKRRQKITVLINSVSVINDYYEITTEDKEAVLRKISDAIEKMYEIPYVYDPNSYGVSIGSKFWGVRLCNVVRKAFYTELQQIDNVHKDIPYIHELMEKNEHGMPESESIDDSGPCYVATAVYGSYDCPQVWTLRRYRDYTLAETWYGRAFIRTYYAISPTLVKWFGHTEWFKKMWKGTLDRMVNNLNAEGVENTPYKDRQW